MRWMIEKNESWKLKVESWDHKLVWLGRRIQEEGMSKWHEWRLRGRNESSSSIDSDIRPYRLDLEKKKEAEEGRERRKFGKQRTKQNHERPREKREKEKNKRK